MPPFGHLEAGAAALLAATVVAAGGACALCTWGLIPMLRRLGLLDRPNDRSSHVVPTPRGGGIAVIGVVLLAWLGFGAAGWVSPEIIEVALAAAALAVVCWLDDLYSLAPATRLAAQAGAVAIGLLALPAADNPVAAWLGAPVYMTAIGLLWVWWVNLYNFMDGIDGIAATEASAIGGGLALFAAVGSGTDVTAALLAAPILGAALGFLAWNWSPARIFLGDVGSAPLGYLTGYLLIALAGAGRWKIALLLPLYFFADATITLARRLLRGERIWQAHRQHFYQQAVRAGQGHAAVVRRVLAADLALIGCGWTAENGGGAISLAAGAAVVALLLANLARRR